MHFQPMSSVFSYVNYSELIFAVRLETVNFNAPNLWCLIYSGNTWWLVQFSGLSCSNNLIQKLHLKFQIMSLKFPEKIFKH